MTSSFSNISPEEQRDYTKTDINGLPATYVLAKNPSDLSGESYVVAKVLDIPDIPSVSLSTHEHSRPNPVRVPSSYISYNFSETPLHLCDPASLVTQYRRGDPNLAHRTIDISKHAYTDEEMSWYADPESKIPSPRRLVMIQCCAAICAAIFRKQTMIFIMRVLANIHMATDIVLNVGLIF